MSTVLFLSGFGTPEIASKSPLFFDEKSWKCKTIFYKSKMPTSPVMVEHELSNLSNFISFASEPVHIVGHSLGAWWAATLACRKQTEIAGFTHHKMGKVVLWTPLGIAGVFPFFKAAVDQEPFNSTPNPNYVGPDKTLVVYAKYDLIVPYVAHALPLISKFKAKSLSLNGGHVWQTNHAKGLQLMKHWLEVE